MLAAGCCSGGAAPEQRAGQSQNQIDMAHGKNHGSGCHGRGKKNEVPFSLSRSSDAVVHVIDIGHCPQV